MRRQPTDRRRCRLAFVLQLLFLLQAVTGAAHAGEPGPDLEVFVRAGCPHCEAARAFIEELRLEQPSLRIAVYDVNENPAAWQRLSALMAARGSSGVPTFLIGPDVVVGFVSAETTGADIRTKLAQRRRGLFVPAASDSITTTWFGEVRVRDLGFPLFTVVIGLLDGFNPCAMWVLLFLLSLLVHLHDRRKMALIAGTFVFVSGCVYFLFMAAWLNVFLLSGLSRAIQIGLGGVALLIGAVSIKDFFALRRGITLSIPESAKPGFYACTRRILHAENLAGALGGIVVLAGLVNMVELLCTAGLPALYTQILTLRQLSAWEYYGYLGLYNLAYIFDDGLMVAIAVVTLNLGKLQEREGRWLKLVTGLVMTSLGTVLLFQPSWLI